MMIIGCGMYAFTPSLVNAWGELFGPLHHFLPAPYNHPFDIHFEDKTDLLSDQGLFIGLTCGYPYINFWHKSHDVVCVPDYDIPGCNNKNYSSWIITGTNSNIKSLADCAGKTAAINNIDSNSGMNVLRHKISKEIDPPAVGEPFFDRVLISGSHVDSMKLVVSGKADVAAIDAVSFFHCQNENLLEVGKLKVIGQSAYTPGLPFIIPRVRDIDKSVIIDGLNKCLEAISTGSSEILKIQSFLSINHEDYQPIKQMELDVINVGYPELI